MISVEEARKIILEYACPGGVERTSLLQAVGRVLAEEVRARRDQPPWDNSAMDGFAVRWENIRDASRQRPAVLKVVEEIPAGRLPERVIRDGQAARIMTGAPMPEGADTVVRKEDASDRGAEALIFSPGAAGEYVRPRGGDVAAGSLLMDRGTVLSPAHIGMLASSGRGLVTVYRRPRVAILATGDELADLDEPLTPEKIMNANSYALGAQVLEAGAEPLLIGIARDTQEDLKEKMAQALSVLGDGDALVSCGGVSVGKYDFVKEVYDDLGVRVKFWGVAMKPGSPLAFGMAGGRMVFGLPGNPVSSMVTFELFVRPALRRSAGAVQIDRPRLRAILAEDLRKDSEKSHFLRGVVTVEAERYVVRTTGIQDSGVLSSMLAANALIILPGDRMVFPAGEEVEVHLLRPL